MNIESQETSIKRLNVVMPQIIGNKEEMVTRVVIEILNIPQNHHLEKTILRLTKNNAVVAYVAGNNRYWIDNLNEEQADLITLFIMALIEFWRAKRMGE